MNRLFAIGCVVLIVPAIEAQEKPLSKIVFGSCVHQEKPQPVWKAILAQKPEFFLFLGDNIYADTDDMEVMRKKYQQLGSQADYQQLRKACPILATWDDHDYGKNDAGVEYAKKEESQKLFLEFFQEPKTSPLWTQKGIYTSRIVGPEGKRVQIIMLDGRYFRSAMKRGKREPGMTYTPYIANTDPDATILGAEQWKWLEAELKKPAEVRLLVSGIQVVAEDHGFEKWMNFPNEREKLFKLIQETKANGIICLSGDRHLAELSMMTDAVGYPLYDLTSSGLNQGFQGWRKQEKNRHRVATMNSGNNFGVVAIDWTATDPIIRLQIRDEEGETTIQEKFLLSVLQQGKTPPKIETKDLPKLKDGEITAADALKKVGDKVTVVMKVEATGGSPKTRIYLNSKKNFRDEDNLAVVVQPKALTGKWKNATGDTFKDKVIHVTGTVSTFNKAIQILVDDEKQLEIVEK